MSVVYAEKDAVLSDDGVYRYLLRRVWDHRRLRMLYVMLNPSTADADMDDATIRSCVRLAHDAGYGSFEVVNLFALRSTDPAVLINHPDPVGNPKNADVVVAALGRCDVAVCAWGAHPMAGERGRLMVSTIKGYKPAAYCLGRTKAGYPRHPLYVRSGTALEVYP